MELSIVSDALPETKRICEQLLSHEQQHEVQAFLRELELKQGNYKADILWKMDQKIGGIGGYCMPSHPTMNPFPGGPNRELFRPLQYARSRIDICDIRIHSREVVQYSGMHLEAVSRFFLSRSKAISKWRLRKLTLGQAAHKISAMNIMDRKIGDALLTYVALYNRAKHEVNMDEERRYLFSPLDAVVCYACARIIGQAMLTQLHYPPSSRVYDINDEVADF